MLVRLLRIVPTRKTSFYQFFISVRTIDFYLKYVCRNPTAYAFHFVFSPIFTSTFSILNRRLLDLDDEWKNIRLKNAEDTTEKLFKQISEGLKRLTTEVFSKSKKTSQEEDLDPENITQKGFHITA